MSAAFFLLCSRGVVVLNGAVRRRVKVMTREG